MKKYAINATQERVCASPEKKLRKFSAEVNISSLIYQTSVVLCHYSELSPVRLATIYYLHTGADASLQGLSLT